MGRIPTSADNGRGTIRQSYDTQLCLVADHRRKRMHGSGIVASKGKIVGAGPAFLGGFSGSHYFWATKEGQPANLPAIAKHSRLWKAPNDSKTSTKPISALDESPQGAKRSRCEPFQKTLD